jgi:hypothetical protein
MRTPRRFDTDLMLPPDANGVADAALSTWLRRWCEQAAFPLTEPLRITKIAPQPGLDHAACELDGSFELQRLGRWRGLAWRVQLLLRECLTANAARSSDPWDCGWWRAGTLDAAASFQPRRATLLMLREPTAAQVEALRAALEARSATFTCPVRVLIVSSTGA